MPGPDGIAVARKLKDDPRTRDVPVIFLTAKSTASDAEAKAIEQRIWLIWSQSLDPPLDLLMQEGVLLLAQSRYRGALERFDRMVEQAPDFAEAWNAGYTGEGSTVAVLDGGTDWGHPDLIGTWQVGPDRWPLAFDP